MTAVLTRVAIAFCTAGSDASGVTVATYSSVLMISSRAYRATTDSVASSAAISNRTTAPVHRQPPWRRRGDGGTAGGGAPDRDGPG